MSMLDDMFGKAVPGGNIAKPLIIALGALLLSGALTRKSAPAQPDAPDDAAPDPATHDGGLLGGLGGLLERFQKAGQGDVAKSWIGQGENQPISPGQLGGALGPDLIRQLAERTGMSEQDLLAQLSKVLPNVVDQMTPNGQISIPHTPYGNR